MTAAIKARLMDTGGPRGAGRARERRRCLFVQYTADRGGSTISGQLTVQGLLRAGWDVHCAFADRGEFARLSAEAGCKTHVVKHGQWLVGGSCLKRIRRWGREVRSMARFVRLMLRNRPDVVYVNTLMGLAAVAAARLLGIPCIWHIREQFDDVGGEMYPPALGGRSLVRTVVRHLPTRVVANSRTVVGNVVGRPMPSKVVVVPNAVASSFFEGPRPSDECRRRLRLPPAVPIVGLPGTLRPVKGHPVFLDSAGLVLKQIPKCHFAISGNGHARYREDLETQSRRLGLQGRVYFVGTVEDMRDFYGACQVACVPSSAETFGRVVIEAFAMGVPVVASAVGGICEIVENGVTGLLVPYGDVDGLADRILRLLDDAALRQRLTTVARHRAESLYREEQYHSRICSIVEEVASGRKGRISQ